MNEIKSTRDYRIALHWFAYGLKVKIFTDAGDTFEAENEGDIWKAKGDAEFVGFEV